MSHFKLTIFVHRYYILITIYAIVINWVIVIIFVSTNMWKLCITFSFPYISFKPFFHHQQLQKRLIKIPIFFIFQIQIKFLVLYTYIIYVHFVIPNSIFSPMSNIFYVDYLHLFQSENIMQGIPNTHVVSTIYIIFVDLF